MERDSGAPCSSTETITNENQSILQTNINEERLRRTTAERCKYLFSSYFITTYPFLPF